MFKLTHLILVVLACWSLPPHDAIAQRSADARSLDDSAAARVARQFHEYLASGDSAGAVRLLAPDFVALEAGSIESRAEYLAHHLGADIEFAKAVRSPRDVQSLTRQGDIVWIVSSSRSNGKMGDRQIDSR